MIREWWDEVVWPLVSVLIAVVALVGLLGIGFAAGTLREAERHADKLTIDAPGWPEGRLVLEMRGCEGGGKRYFREVQGTELRGSSRAPEAKR